MLFLFFSTLSTFFMRNVLSVWFIIELNFLCFVRIISYQFTNNNTNGNIYYFLIQSLGRVLILLRALNFLIFRHFFFEATFFIFLLLKLGGAPFQFWYLKLIQKIRWVNIWLISVWQKLIPLLLIKLINYYYLILFGLLRVIIGSLNNLNQKKIKKILGLSSIFSLGWTMLSILQSKVWLLFILGYGLILWVLLASLNSLKIININYLENSNLSIVFYLIFFLGLLIIRGIPPFLMFYLKILILLELVKLSFLIVFLLLILSIFIIYIYLIMGFRFLSFLKAKSFYSRHMSFHHIYCLSYLFYNILFTAAVIIFL